MLFDTLAALSGLLVLLTLLPLLRYEVWWIRGLDFPRLQLASVALALAVAIPILLDRSSNLTWLMMAAMLACFCYHAWWIYPYTRMYPVEVLQADDAIHGERIRILSANVLTPNRQADAFLKLVRENDPDVLVTLETDLWWQERLDVLEADYPHTMKCPLDNLYGMHLYSKLPLEDAEIQFLVEPDKPSMHAAVVLPTGLRVRMHFVHPAPPSPTENDESTERDAELLVIAKSVAESKLPVVVTGDLNDVAWSATTRLFRKISGLLDPRIGRGMFNTFHAGYRFIRFPVDHVFHSRHFTVADIRRLPYYGSDHFPMLVELAYDKRIAPLQHGLPADEEDREWADEKTGEKDVEKDDVHAPDEEPALQKPGA